MHLMHHTLKMIKIVSFILCTPTKIRSFIYKKINEMLRDTFNKRIVQCLYAENDKTLLRRMREDVINGEICYVYRLEYML